MKLRPGFAAVSHQVPERASEHFDFFSPEELET